MVAGRKRALELDFLNEDDIDAGDRCRRNFPVALISRMTPPFERCEMADIRRVM